jgi:hypothetical protein
MTLLPKLVFIAFIVAVLLAITPPPSIAAQQTPWWSIIQNNQTHVCTVVRDHVGWMGGVQVGHFPTLNQAIDGLLPMKRNGVCR